ncbi:MAG: hypothetical protein H6862_01300 [Rhodospirillales bacterium]|nr:hypothetical protein [Rhodospirillales bacterium]
MVAALVRYRGGHRNMTFAVAPASGRFYLCGLGNADFLVRSRLKYAMSGTADTVYLASCHASQRKKLLQHVQGCQKRSLALLIGWLGRRDFSITRCFLKAIACS